MRAIEQRLIIFRTAIVFVIIFASAMLQNGLGIFASLFSARALILLPVVCACGMCCGMSVGLASGIFAGALWDTAATSPDGILALYLGFVGFMCAFLVKNYMRNSMRTALLFSFVSTSFFILVKSFFYASYFNFEGVQALLFSYALPLLFYTMLISPLLYIFIRKICSALQYSKNTYEVLK